jgi:hypothetical protein
MRIKFLKFFSSYSWEIDGYLMSAFPIQVGTLEIVSSGPSEKLIRLTPGLLLIFS